MDPTESILSTLDYSLDHSFASNHHRQDSMLNDQFSMMSTSDISLDDFLNPYLDNDFLLNSDDYMLPAFLNDPFLNSFEDESAYSVAPSLSLHSKRSKSPKTIINNINVSCNDTVSILKNSREKSITVRPKISTPKVYVSHPSKKREGTSILVKKKKMNTTRPLLNGCTKSSLLKHVITAKGSLMVSQNEDKPNSSAGIVLMNNDVYWINNCLKDHDYCAAFFPETDAPTTNFTKTENAQQQAENEFDDILQGYCTDDVVLNELPECLSSLINFDEDGDLINSEDLLNGLNDVCNYMTDKYIEENIMNKDLNLPDLNLTEEDLNQVTQTCNDKPDFEDEDENESATTKEVQMNIIYSNESNVDSFDSASVTTGCTDESFPDAKRLRLKNKSKRHRSLSSSSNLLTKRKRRFSTRSSINSSDSMSDSSPESSSSRSSSPERAFTFASLAHSNEYHAKNFQKFHHQNKKKYRLKGKSWPRSYSAVTNQLTKCQVIDLVSKQKYTLDTTKLETMTNGTGSSQPSPASVVSNSNSNSGDDGQMANENVLYIGNIPDGIKKSDIKNWFGKFGTIEDVQLFTKNNRCFAFVTYQNVLQTNEAIKHGNDDCSHPKFVLSYGKDRRKYYKDLDYFSEKLDFRIEDHCYHIGGDGVGTNQSNDFDSLLRSASEKFKSPNKNYNLV